MSADLQVEFITTWKLLIPMMEQIVRDDKVMVVILPEKEYEHLKKGGLDELKAGVSERLSESINLVDNYCSGDARQIQGPVLLIRRPGVGGSGN